VIGITGTKGKTTTASLIASVLNDNGIPCGYIGTNGITYKDVKKQTLNTTPDPLTLQRTLAEMYDAGMKAVAIEVSSQAILQDRVFGTHFQTTVFTNFSEDHIGPNEHATLEDYKECKHRLFTEFPAAFSVWNADDPTVKDMQCGAGATHHLFYSAQNRAADFTAKNALPTVKHGRTGISFFVSHKDRTEECHLPLIGICNVSNAICTAAVAVGVFGISLASTAASLSRAVVAGRSESYPLPSGAIAIIDYAHNKESLSQVLRALREYHPNRILCLFGSVGERTQLRRRDLAEVAAELADACILTSDNPGNEPPEQIIDEIASFLPASYPHQKIVDRGDAIRTALCMLQDGDVLLLAGKGHENYQLIGNTKVPFDERRILEEFLSTPALI
jgi:UDP-N-acetylmuramoyl-L-alanyl-D-glutamate--2,6-diaminopimelate ligase